MSDTYVDPYAQYLNPAAPPPAAAPKVPTGVVGQTLKAEGTAQNPNSSAVGPGQFINSTWLDMVNKYRPDLAAGKTRDQILSLRTDPNYNNDKVHLGADMTNAYAAENSERLTGAGLQATPSNIYLSHFAGPQGAINVLKADPNTPVSQILKPDAIAANPNIANMTAGQLRTWAAGRVGSPEGYYGGQMHVTVSPQSTQADPYAQFSNPQGGSITTPQAVGLGAAQGLTANFYDELRGLHEAGGGTPDQPFSLGTIMRGALSRVTGDQQAEKTYQATVDRVRQQESQAQEQHPLAYGGGQLGGAVGGMLMTPMATAATLPGRIAQGAALGGAYGGLAGAGEGTDTESRASGALGGAASGVVGGAAAVPVGEAIGKVASVAYNHLIKPTVAVTRGLVNPEKEASRRVVGAIARDVQSGNAGLTPREWLSAHGAGEPVIAADMGGPTTQNLMRSASNTSPEAEGAIREAVDSRYKTQSSRFSDTIRNLVANGANATKSRAQLEAEYDIARIPAYRAAYAQGDKPIWSPELERLTSSPSVAGALRGAINRWKDFQVKDGFGSANPPVNVTPDGQLQFTGGKGMLPYPNIQLWDYAARNLAGAASAARRAGNTTDAGLYGGLEKQLKAELDNLVPSYKSARGTAAEFFGANNAIEAGEKAVSFRGDPIQIKVQMNKMGDAERELFKEGFANKLAEQIEATGDRTNIINKVYNSPQSRRMIETIFGDQGATRIEMRLRLENIMQNAKTALGNSTTAKQLIQGGLAGGALGAYLEGHDLTSALSGFETGAGVGAGIRFGGSKVVGVIDQRVAQKVGELLSSNDLSQLAKGIKIAASNNRIANAIRLLDNRLAATVGSKGGNSALGSIQGTVPSSAQTNQKQ